MDQDEPINLSCNCTLLIIKETNNLLIIFLYFIEEQESYDQ